MNETTILYCIFCYLFAVGDLTTSDSITVGDIITALIAPIATPFVLGRDRNLNKEDQEDEN